MLTFKINCPPDRDNNMIQEIKHEFSVIGGIALLVLTLGVSACTKAKTNAEQHASQKVSSMNIRFDIEGSAEPVFVRLKDSSTTQDFYQAASSDFRADRLCGNRKNC